MAIIYTTGTINQPDAGSVGQAMVERFRDDLVAHTAWDLVEEFTPAGGQVRWYVFKCLAAQSGLASDFFLVIGRTLSNGELRFAVCEGYNAGSHTMSGYGAFSYNGNYDANGVSAATFVLGQNPFSTSTNSPGYQYWIPSGTSTKWWITASEDGFTVAFNGPSNAFVHGGVYIPLTQLPILMPLCCVGYNNSTGWITRNPAVAGGAGLPNYPLQIEGGGSSYASYGPPLGFMGSLQYNDKLQGNQRPVAEQGINMASWPGQPGYQAIIGWALGKQKRWRVTNQGTPVGFAFGDAYALDGNLWVPFAPNDPRMWDTGVAAS
jgi:hypothetical protein